MVMGGLAPPSSERLCPGHERPQPQPWPRSHDYKLRPRVQVIVVIATGYYRDVSQTIPNIQKI